MTLFVRSLLCAGLAAVAVPMSAQAGEVYANVGLPGLGLGYAQPLNSTFTVRGEYSTLGTHHKKTSESGLDYQATAKANRFALLGDWFIWGGLRLTGGITYNDAKVQMLAQGNGQAMTIGNATVTTDSTDRFDVTVKFPRTTPYLGLGYGHQLSSGFGFVFDIGASYGRATVSETHSGNHFSTVSQADIDAEMAQLRDGVGKVRYLPQASIGLAWRF